MARPALKNFRRIVVKVGSSLLIDSGRGRSARVVAVGARRRPRETAWRGPRRADRLVGFDRARTQPAEIAARPVEAGREPGRRRRGPDRAGADLVGSARRARHRRRPDPGDVAGHRGAPPLSQRALDHRQAAGMARGARHQRERHGRDQRDPLRRQRPSRRACRHHGERRSADPAVRHRRPLRRAAVAEAGREADSGGRERHLRDRGDGGRCGLRAVARRHAHQDRGGEDRHHRRHAYADRLRQDRASAARRSPTAAAAPGS